MSAQQKPRERSPIAERVRARLAEMGQTESSFSESFGKDRTTLSTILRRLDAGGNLRSDTITKLEKYLGRPWHWISTGEVVEGFRLADEAGWAVAAAEAAQRFAFTPEQIEAAGNLRVPVRPTRMDFAVAAGFVRALADAAP